MDELRSFASLRMTMAVEFAQRAGAHRGKTFGSENLEARGGIEPPIMVLQTIALPLGDRATGRKSLSVLSNQWSAEERIIKSPPNGMRSVRVKPGESKGSTRPVLCSVLHRQTL